MYSNYPELVHKHPTHLDVHFVNFCKRPQATKTGNLVHMCTTSVPHVTHINLFVLG